MQFAKIYRRIIEIGPTEVFKKITWRFLKLYRKLIFHLYICRKCGILKYAHPNSRVTFVNPNFLNGIPFDCSAELLMESDDILRNSFHIHDHGSIFWELYTIPWSDWEPDKVRAFHRHDFIITLIRAAACTGEMKYIVFLEKLLRILYKCYTIDMVLKYDKAIDIAIRFLNWSAVYSLLNKTSWSKAELRYWYLQLEWINANMSPGGNHRLLEGLGLFAAGLFFTELKRSRIWREKGYNVIIKEMQKQVNVDGGHAEQSMYYHQVCTTHFLKFILLCHRISKPLPNVFLERFQKMLEYIWVTQKPDGSHPMTGDGDQLLTEEREHWESRALVPIFLHSMGSAIDLDIDTEPAKWFIPLEENTSWLIPNKINLKRDSAIYPNTGHVILRDDDKQYLFFNCGEFGYKPFPHHGHSDALSVEICLNGETVVMDPGGYAYKSGPIREFVRGTFAHSTITVDNRNQSEVFGVFGVGKTAKVNITAYQFNDKVDMVEAEHTGYDPVKHVRRIYFIKNGLKTFLINDRVVDSGQHEVSLRYHLAPGLKYFKNSIGGYNFFQDGSFIASCFFIFEDHSKLHIVEDSDLSEIQSIVSKKTGKVETSTLFEVNTMSGLPVNFVTIFSAHEDIIFSADLERSKVTLAHGQNEVAIELDSAFK